MANINDDESLRVGRKPAYEVCEPIIVLRMMTFTSNHSVKVHRIDRFDNQKYKIRPLDHYSKWWSILVLLIWFKQHSIRLVKYMHNTSTLIPRAS